jgi:parallel beta-helix repeat protein
MKIYGPEAKIINSKVIGSGSYGISVSNAELINCEIIANGLLGISGSNFEISNCLVTHNLGSGISGSGSIKNSIISNNGRGIFCGWRDSLLLDSTIITGNNAGFNSKGGGIYLYDSSSLEIRNCIINNNTASDGGGIYCGEESEIIISDCQIDSNENYGLKLISSSAQLKNSEINNNIGGGIYSLYGAPRIENCIISNNIGAFGGGACFEFSHPTLSHNLFFGNTALCGGAINCRASDMHLINNTIVNNTADSLGGGISCYSFCEPLIENTIIWNNSPEPFYHNYSSELIFTYCDIDAEITGEGNIFEDPIFCNPEENNYELSNISPCLGAGQNGADIGALGIGCFSTDVTEDDDAQLLPKEFGLGQNYPNPFNPSTVIEYALPKACPVKIEIYNLLGQCVKVLIDDEQPAGWYSVTWDGTDRFNSEVATGMYFYRIKAGDFHKTRKMLLVK